MNDDSPPDAPVRRPLRSYRIERSATMQEGTWVPVETVTPGYLGWFRRSYVYTGESKFFYRVKELP